MRKPRMFHISIQASTLVSVVVGQTIILMVLASMILVANDRAERANARTNLAVTCLRADLAEHRWVNRESHKADAAAHGYQVDVPPMVDAPPLDDVTRLAQIVAEACRSFAVSIGGPTTTGPVPRP